MTVPRSRRVNQAAMEPTLPDQPVACARPLITSRTAKVATELAKPNMALARMVTAMPTSNMSRGPQRSPTTLAMNCPTA